MGSYISREDFEDFENNMCKRKSIKHNRRHIGMNKHNGRNTQVSQPCKTSSHPKGY